MEKTRGSLTGGRSALYALMSCLCFLLAPADFQRERAVCHLTSKNYFFEPKYVQDGDIIIGGIFTVRITLMELSIKELHGSAVLCDVPVSQYYRHLLAFIFAIDEINSNLYILPNVTLGYHALDSCGNINKAIDNVLQILSGPTMTVPNYSCWSHSTLAGVIGDLSSETSLHIANILSLYRYPQISYGATDPLLSNKKLYPSFFQTLPNDQIQFDAIIKLLKYFSWNWVGIIASDDDAGERQTRELKNMGEIHSICFEFTLKLPPQNYIKRRKVIERNKLILNRSTSQIIVLTGSASLFSVYLFRRESGDIHKKTFIIPASWNTLFISGKGSTNPLDGGLAFERPINDISNLQHFLENVSPSSRPNDLLLEDIRLFYLNCLTSDPLRNKLMELKKHKVFTNCSRTDTITKLGHGLYETVRFRTTHHVYKSVYAMAIALHVNQLYFSKKIGKSGKIFHAPNYGNILRRIHFQDPSGEDVYFNENGEMATVYQIRNYALFHNESVLEQDVGIFNVSAPEGEQLAMNKSDIIWKYNSREIISSRCSEDCPPGYRRVLHKGKHTCCFDCVPCSEGEISNTTGGDSCQTCPENQWPNEKKDNCVQKPIEFLSYKDNLIAFVFSTISVLMSVITFIILIIFILYRDTPIVRANNRNLSFVLLLSLILSFLCVFLFLGRPVDITCMLRQTAFGVIFSVAVSSVLAKTIMVCIAFKATKPGSYWRKWIGVKIPNYVVFICSFIQLVISISWLSISPPYQEMNSHSYPGKIIIQCNEGSVVAFYIVLGYMGFLAAVSFVVAFLARKLPDSFNEAKYITFSMLVFCNVWISFIPAYMSVIGKNAVIVEIFAILASSAGILFCIFLPKCYIILVKPDMNTKRCLLKPGI